VTCLVQGHFSDHRQLRARGYLPLTCAVLGAAASDSPWRLNGRGRRARGAPGATWGRAFLITVAPPSLPLFEQVSATLDPMPQPGIATIRTYILDLV
jgi:hypothetical protein